MFRNFLRVVTLVAAILALNSTGAQNVASVVQQSRKHIFRPSSGPQEIVRLKKSGVVDLPAAGSRSFSLRLTVDNNSLQSPTLLLYIDNVLTVRSTHPDGERADIQNYWPYIGDGSGLVLEAGILLTDSLTSARPQKREMTIGVPVALLDMSRNKHDVLLNFTGTRLSLYVDGVLYDNDFAIGFPSSGLTEYLVGKNVLDIGIIVPVLEAINDEVTTSAAVQYWTPPYFNAWVGDVVSCWYDNRYHLFYLFDRRGHKSKFGRGGHYFEHLSTSDFVTWVEHDAATPLEEQWECIGTGTPVVHDGKIFLNYGLHTTRMYPEERTVIPGLRREYNEIGCIKSLSIDTLTGRVPAGSTMAVSNDGKTFTKSGIVYHYCENPSIYADTIDHKFYMLANYGARGTWVSDSISDRWSCINPDFPPGGDCTFPFTVGDYDYIIGGFSGLWGKPRNSTGDYVDIVKEGKDCYNGLSVPAVTTLPDGRVMMAGWLKTNAWGGVLAIHEIVADDNEGTLGTRWVDTLIPDVPTLTVKNGKNTVGDGVSFISSFDIITDEPGAGRVVIKFGERAFWVLDLEKDRAWYASSLYDLPKTLGEGGDVSGAVDYAIPARVKRNTKIPVRILAHYDPKLRGTVIDIEIDSRRTMLSYRKNLRVDGLTLDANGATVNDK